MSDTRKKNDGHSSNRLCFPDDEPVVSWLPMLLDAYAIIDSGVSVAVSGEERRRNARLSCKEGCDNCCRTHKDIPVYPLELVGIYWFSIEKILQPARGILKGQLLGHAGADACLFLINGSCSIHPMRPVACRQFNVFGKPCEEGEDPYYTRRDDVLTPIREYTDKAIYTMLPFYGVTAEAEKKRVVRNNLIHTQVRVLQSCNWKELAGRME